ncbi:MAG TPA: hypothetical protein DEO56_04170 [Nitrosomonas nitrosa]|uniref:LEA14-like dessication related protein n=1 Tax=Nitrosomonas nitrosa TaxID=52442 RepID=A0A1I4UT18_9PROT|nr:LEA type 2 family protein [Nitrosomonas nitrosa]PTR04811.1 LEA14-like dessication related protein [Nitrosomonas nitrosa]CAE6486733.1 conserved hypothetical protein [Nitrosomonas nitrosa]SFM92127.1 LEA14-like dessication related protein [Nitrosomonas nitrosa]HBZ29776.1 hypothetical protein [Nitrosomonas nitrosa]HNP52368.1 LEA type 2 family protein [Nitrosomonas nitrosa]
MQTQPFFRTQIPLDAAPDNDWRIPDGGIKRIVLILFLGMIVLVTGCVRLAGIKQNPDISLAGIELVELGLLEQRFNLKLRIQNPNDVALPINGMTFEIELDGATFARGLSDKVVTVPRLGEIVMEVKAASTLGMVWKQLVESQKSRRDKVDYRLSGRLFLQGLGSVPFEQKGNVSMPNSTDDLEKL